MGKPLQDPTFAALTAIRHWRDKRQLVDYALARHGYADTDSGFGITYPGDLDEFDRQTQSIPEGFVLAHGFGGPPDGYEIMVPEWLYRDVLAEVLECLGFWQDAAKVRVAEGWLGPK
jgi:hypothetical protein